MAGLAETLSRLKHYRGATYQPRTPVPGDRLTDIDDFGSDPGQLRARLYVPSDLAAGSALIVVLHGCTQTAAGYDVSSGWSDLADRHGFALLFPEQRQSNNPNLCFNWFVPHHIRRGSGEACSIKQMIDTVCARHAIDRTRIFVTGLSAGGAMAGVMLATYPEMFAGGAIIAGLPYGLASSVPSAFQLMGGQVNTDPVELMAKVRSASDHQGTWPIISVWHGAADHTVQAVNAGAVVNQWRMVHDVAASPDRTETVGGFSRRVWRDSRGRDVIEEYRIPGMAHGTPIDLGSGIGHAAPFMLDVGICSSQQVLRFWGVADTVQPAAAPASAQRPAATPNRLEPATVQRPVPSSPVPPRPAAVAGVGKVIEDALRAAGLMK